MIDFLLHFDTQLPSLLAQHGTWVYALVFLIIFCETGLVITPFLPGDSMLFALGTFAAQGSLDIAMLAISLSIAAILGDSVNYALGSFFGQRLLQNPRQKFFKPEHYQKAHDFYEKYGAKAIILARFIPIVRTFAPFVAGIARMSYRKFLTYNIIGGVLWIGLFLGVGYGLGTLPWVKVHFKLIILCIMFVSILPVLWELWQAQRKKAA